MIPEMEADEARSAIRPSGWWRHPVAEMELRRQAGSLSFFLVRTMFATVGAVFATGLLLRAAVHPMGIEALGHTVLVATDLLALLLLVAYVPPAAASLVVAARTSGTLDAMVLTGCREWRVAFGLWSGVFPGAALSILGLAPCLLLAVGIGGATSAQAAAALLALTASAAVLAALAIVGSIRASVPVASLLSTAAFALLVAPAVAASLPRGRPNPAPPLVSAELVWAFTSLGLLAATPALLLFAGRTLGRRALRELRRSRAESRITDADPGFARTNTIGDPIAHVLRSTGALPRRIAHIGTLLLLPVALARSMERGAPILVPALFLACTAAAWTATLAAEKLLTPHRAADLAIAGLDADHLRAPILRHALGVCAWPVALVSMSFASNAVVGDIPPRTAFLAMPTIPACWLLSVLFALHLSHAFGTGRPTTAIGLVTAFIAAGAVPAIVGGTGAYPVALFHPLALVTFLATTPDPPWTMGGPLLLATAAWTFVPLLVLARQRKRLDRLFREPLRS